MMLWDLSTEEASKKSGIAEWMIKEFLKGTLNVNTLLAVRLQKLTGVKSDTWLTMQKNYDG